jgi:Cu2+-exporting ATPase
LHNWPVYDRAEALRRYTHLREDGERELSVQIDGMHCAACAWLVESSLGRLDGVLEIHVNASSARAEIRFDPARIALSQVLARMHELGFRPQPLSFSAGAPPWMAERREALKRLAVAGFGMMQVMTYAVSLYAGAMDGIAPDLAQLLRFVSLLVSTPVVLYAAQPFFVAAWRGLRAGTLGMDLPVALSIGAAYGWSVWSTLRGEGTVYFDSAVMFTFFLLLGRYIEMSLRHRFGHHHDAIARLLPQSVLRITDPREERVIPDELCVGDRVRILPGERVPADGEVICGRTQVDESLLSGESMPRTRVRGDLVTAGTLNITSVIELRVTGVGPDSTLATVSRMLERARASRPRLADVADGAAAWFVGGVLLLAVVVGLYWWHVDAARAFPVVLAVLVVTCPCALSLATPAALAAGTSRLATLGLLVTRGRAIEALSRADRVVFDKTGTLTSGQVVVGAVHVLRAGTSTARCIGIAASLERHSEHPIARAFAEKLRAADAEDVLSSASNGVHGRIDGVVYRIGRAAFCKALCPSPSPDPASLAGDARASVFLGDADGPLAEFVLSDGLRADSRETIDCLRNLGLEPLVASGDRSGVVEGIARQLGNISARGDMSAADKVSLVSSLQEQGHIVIMVGDGVNDAPVLAGSDVSVAIGGGTDLAKVSADVVLLGDSLGPLRSGVETARRCMHVIRQNMLWAIIYNATAVPLAASGWLQPWMAAIGMSTSSLLVVLNAMRLLNGPSPSMMSSLKTDVAEIATV